MANRGRTVLLVEDEAITSMFIEDAFRSHGWLVAGPAATLVDAVAIARTGKLDGAVLDVNLGGDLSFPVAHILRERHIPFVFATAYGSGKEIPEFAEIPVVRKPFSSTQLVDALESHLTAVSHP